MATAELPEGLLAAAKNELDITWDDSATDEKLSGSLLRGMNYLNGITGTQEDYILEGQPRALLFAYIRYDRDHALEDYQKNYLPELLALQICRRLQRGEAEDGAAG